MGFRACGSLDGELAYLIKNIKKKNIYRGGVSYIARNQDLSLKEIISLAKTDAQTNLALKAYISELTKAVYAISSSYSSKNKITEILVRLIQAKIKLLKYLLQEDRQNYIIL